MLSAFEFYRDESVIRRMLEYCGVPVDVAREFRLEHGTGGLSENRSLRRAASVMSAEWLAGSGDFFLRTRGKKHSSRYPEKLGELLDGGLNVFRSCWDRQSVLFFFDVEYLSHRFPGECYANQEAVFSKLEPVYRCIMDTFGEYGIKPITVATGQGYHFVFKVNSYDRHFSLPDRKVTETASRLVDLGFLEETLQGKYMHLPFHTKRRRVVEPDLGRAFDTVGKLLEFVANRVVQRAPGYGCRLPLGIGDLVPGNDKQEIINLDLSTYIEPLFTRGLRMLFSIHDKHKDPKKESDPRIRGLPVSVAIPRYTPCNGNELGLGELFHNRHHFRNSANYAAAITAEIPDCSGGVDRLLDAYYASDLFRFHFDFDRTDQESPSDWGRTYDRFDISQLPPCIAMSLAEPNPFLLRPQHVQSLVRVLTGKGWWHPSHVAGLIRSKYERDHKWDFNWGKYDANRHARGWVRFYAGQIATGIDQRSDQNCISQQEKGLCVKPFCGYDLGSYR
ncbi:hypothetical protein KY363_00975 [Candidatus Woesearchaeota archaeon]|nr:hypothetical protein [Candidatus Woesearchaeota archaeon]